MEGRNPEVAGGEKDTQQEANALEAAGVPLKPPPELPLPELATDEPEYVPQDEEEQLLFGDPTGQGAEIPAPRGRRVPPEVIRRLPALARAARSPDAPPALVALYRLTIRELEDEMKTLG